MPSLTFMWKDEGKTYEGKDGAFSAVFSSRLDLDGDYLKKRLQGSYTIEAAFVMAIVLWAVLVSLQAAYQLRDETAGAMALHGAAERLIHGEDENAQEAESYALRLAGRPFSWKAYEFKIEEYGGLLTGKKIRAAGKGGRWSLEISQKEYDPENFLRMCSLLGRKE